MYRWAQWFAAVLAVFGVVLVVLGDVLPGLYGLLAAAVIAVLPALRIRASFQRHPLASRTVTGTADDHSVRMAVDELARSELAWTRLPAWQETPQGIVLRTGPGRADPIYPVPHRAFADPDDEQRFRELLHRHIGPASG
ncbi:YcxB family protein [Goodfellowiella coeruleoviolacea]|nr:YcxB family protein [Goodfellowiella coeruleoviolacea]